MKNKKTIIVMLTFAAIIMTACSDDSPKGKGFSVSPESARSGDDKIDGLTSDTIAIDTRPIEVLLTDYNEHRLTSIFKVNYNKRKEEYYTGSNRYHRTYLNIADNDSNNWNSNFMPGFEATYGYNMVNISHRNTLTNKSNNFFDKPVLIRTLYYPSYTQDTLNNQLMKRDFYMVSVYDEDTNKDGFINLKDLRRFYRFGLSGGGKTLIVPADYSVYKSEYDQANDLMYIFATHDENANGMKDELEKSHVFWLNLKDIRDNGRMY